MTTNESSQHDAKNCDNLDTVMERTVMQGEMDYNGTHISATNSLCFNLILVYIIGFFICIE